MTLDMSAWTLGDVAKQAIGVVAFCLNVWGNLELTKQGNRGHIIPEDGATYWGHYEALVNGFGQEHSREWLAERAQGIRVPRAYRLRTSVEAEPLTAEKQRSYLRRCVCGTMRTRRQLTGTKMRANHQKTR